MRESVCVLVWPLVFDGRGEGGIRGLETVISPLLAMNEERKRRIRRRLFFHICSEVWVLPFFRNTQTLPNFAKILKSNQQTKKLLP